MSGSQAQQDAQDQLNDYLSQNGLKQTRQREAILRVFLAAEGHLTSEEVHEAVREGHPEIGAATVYRTLKLLCDAGIANAHHFRDGVTLYERRGRHHDHLICQSCGEIVEFRSEVIEREQDEVAKRHGYRLTKHRHILYGTCARCREE